MGLGKAISVDDQPHHHWLAIGTFIPRIAVLGLRIRHGLALKIRRGQVIEINRLIQVKEGPFPLAERRFNLLPLGMQSVQVAVQRGPGEGLKLHAQDILQSGATNPFGHGMFGTRTD
jgi:hypothetical protein